MGDTQLSKLPKQYRKEDIHMKNAITAILYKLTSRKLWTALAGVITGLSIIFGADESTAATISGAVVSSLSVLTYIITEGKIDAAAVRDASELYRQTADRDEN